MAKYELTIVINPALDEEKRKKLIDKIKEWVEKGKGRVEKTEDWGKKQLAYPIKKLKEGYFLLFVLEIGEKETQEIRKKLNLEEEIIRYLLLRVEPQSARQPADSVRGK